jgi:hypothetical protein
MAHEEALRQIVEAVPRLSDDELRRVLDLLSSAYRDRLKQAEQRAALLLAPGDEVETSVDGRRVPRGSRGRVVHLTRTRVHVDFGERGIWAMLATALVKVAATQPTRESQSAVSDPPMR